MNIDNIKRAAAEIEKNTVALKWLEEYGASYTDHGRNEVTFEIRLHYASACPGAKEAQEIMSSLARRSLPVLIKTATQNCRNTIAICEDAIRGEGENLTEANLSKAARDVLAERVRQISEEGWTPEHDDEHKEGTLALAACCYAMPVKELCSMHGSGTSVWRVLWPWDHDWWKPKGRRRDLVRAGALIIAEIERIDRAGAEMALEPGEKLDPEDFQDVGE